MMTLANIAHGQHMVQGQVIDQQSQKPVPGTQISLLTGQSTISDQEGKFHLSVFQDTSTIVFSAKKYQTRQLFYQKTPDLFIVELNKKAIDLKELIISKNITNTSFHMLASLNLNLHPMNSAQDLMRLVPGLFLAQHMGGGKAEQLFIRGFDADHGTDVNITVDGIPVNMVSHIHGQGYADLHFLIPETVSSFEYGKGVYYADQGDFTTAGYIKYSTKEVIDKNLVSIEGGQFHSRRLLAIINLLNHQKVKNSTNAFVAGEYNYSDGPFLLPERFSRVNLFGKLSGMMGKSNVVFTASTFFTNWRASGEIPVRVSTQGSLAIDDAGNRFTVPLTAKLQSRFAAIDSAQGGRSSRSNISLKITSPLGNHFYLENQVYYTYYKFKLRVNSTFYAIDSLNGDRKEQQEARNLFGYRGKLVKQYHLGNTSFTSTLGLETRFDRTFGSEYSNINSQNQFLSDITRGNINQNNTSLYIDQTVENGNWLLNFGNRFDHFSFRFHDSTRYSSRFSPKLNIAYSLNKSIQLYLKVGKGFHSNNAIAVIGNNAVATLPSAYGADLGVNLRPLKKIFINAAFWYLNFQQEFVYTDDGSIAASGKTKRKGIDLSARYQIQKWLSLDFNVNFDRPRFADSSKNKGYLPLAPTLTSTGGINVNFLNGINGGLSYRYIHSRAGNSTNTLQADGYFIADLKLNYTRKWYELGLSIENLFNTTWNEYEAEKVSRLKYETKAIDQMSFTAGTPLFAKLRYAVFF